MFENLVGVERRFLEIDDSLASGAMKPQDVTRLTRERAELEPLVTMFRRYLGLKADMETARAMLEDTDPASRAFGKEEVARLERELEATERELIILTLPKDPNDNKSVLLEVRAGTGGEEAALFAADLFRMYKRYADRAGWATEVLSVSPSEKGGFKEVICLITGGSQGQGVYSRLKFESGVHRVQRVPETEAQGRIHTSACTVAILPEADDVEVSINPADLDISATRASGAGGQHVNRTDSAIRIVHRPSGLVVECQDERSQHKNKDKALKILKARLKDKAIQEQQAAISANRRSQVGSGDRSERIRTYNFPQGRLTDHRINLTLYRLDGIIDGDLDEVLDALGSYHQTELLKRELTGHT